MSLSSFSSLSSYSSESDIGTLLDFKSFKFSSSRLPRAANAPSPTPTPTPTRQRSLESPRSKERRPSSSSRHTHMRAKRRSITPTRTPVSSFKYDDGARAPVPYSLHSPGSKSGISYSDINRWRAAAISGSEFTYSSEYSVTVSSATSPSYFCLLYTAFTHRQLKSPFCRFRLQTAKSSVYWSQHPHPSIHHDPTQICEHCRMS
jgi:hypothetical protein